MLRGQARDLGDQVPAEIGIVPYGIVLFHHAVVDSIVPLGPAHPQLPVQGEVGGAQSQGGNDQDYDPDLIPTLHLLVETKRSLWNQGNGLVHRCALLH
jgi:hypothetical protein